jgi:DNA-binding NtrC family response regulator
LNLAELSRLDQTGWSFPIAGRDLLQLATFTGFSRVKKALELLLIEGAVATAGGSATGAARQLGLPYTTLVSRQKALRSDGTV